MIQEVPERVLVYRQADLEAWKGGDRSRVPSFYPLGLLSSGQPNYGFGEMLTLRYYHEAHGWWGFLHYDFGPHHCYYPRRRRGRQQVQEVVPQDRPRALVPRHGAFDGAHPSAGNARCPEYAEHQFRRGGALAELQVDHRRWTGRPDLFLYRGVDDFMFVEVKKGTDRLREPQFRFIAQIMAVLECRVDVVYVREERQHYEPRRYRFDLEVFTGECLR